MTMRHTASLLSVLALTAVMTGHAVAQSADDLKNDEKTPGDVLVYGMGYSGNRYSPLTQINKENVAKLVPVWGHALTDNRGAEGFPLVKDGVIYDTAELLADVRELVKASWEEDVPARFAAPQKKAAE